MQESGKRIEVRLEDAKSQGFSLIELLVVIAIIAVLAAIMFPVFVRMRETARRGQCTSNLKQIGHALAMYRDDYGQMPSIWHAKGGPTYEQNNFFFVITRYVGQQIERSDSTNNNHGKGNATRYTVYKCMSAPWLKQDFTPQSMVNNGRTNVGFAYTMNETGWRVVRGPRVPWVGKGLRDSEVAMPHRLIFVAEGMGWQYYGCGYGDGSLIDNEKPSGNAGWVSNNPPADEEIPLSQEGYIGLRGGSLSKIYNIRVSHGGGAMCLFYDGHIEWRKVTRGINWTSRPCYY
ncbi:MAG: DUF1559 domain-containing protein [Armatimonadetes bacterium]|nr:DUF1559 domain-containing protein [Armatimonadota bacterium]